jgi:hypothetical protein
MPSIAPIVDALELIFLPAVTERDGDASNRTFKL